MTSCGVDAAEQGLGAGHTGRGISSGQMQGRRIRTLGQGVKAAVEGRGMVAPDEFNTGCDLCTGNGVGT